MSKRNKAKFASKARKSALRVEALEQRQLLATIVSGADAGTEVGSNISYGGNVYDQVLLKGSAVTVDPDDGQIVRVSFLDLNGDIVQAEFSGTGTLTVSLEDFEGPAAPENYNQPGVQYVSGNATFTIQNTDGNSHFSVFSVGAANGNGALFLDGKTGGDHHANVQAIRIVNNPANEGGFSNFGGIRAANAIFSGDSGSVGIAAANINVQGPVRIGDIDATDAGVPTLNFGADSQFATLEVYGGDLDQSNGATIENSIGGAVGFQAISFLTGTDSAGETVRAQFNPDLDLETDVDTATIDSTTEIDIDGLSQTAIDDLFEGRTFTQDLTITGNLTAVRSINATEFRGDVTFEGDVLGNIDVDGGFGSLTITGDVEGDITIDDGDIGGLSVTGDLSGTITANNIGDVMIDGDLSGLITTDFDDDDAFTVDGDGESIGEGSIGNVTVTGSITDEGAVEGVLGIGDILVEGDITSDGALGGGGVFSTHSGDDGDAFLADIGTLTVEGDVDQDGTDDALINITNNGTFGNVTIKGAGESDDETEIGAFIVAGELGGDDITTGAIDIAEEDEDVLFAGVFVEDSEEGTVGALNITGGGENALTFVDGIDIGTLEAGEITASNFLNITVDDDVYSSGDISLATSDEDEASITVNDALGAGGTLELNAGAGDDTVVTIDGSIETPLDDDGDSVAFGDVTITAADIAVNGTIATEDADAGAFTFNGDTTITGDFDIDGDVDSITIDGDATLSGGFVVGDLGSLTITGSLEDDGAFTFETGEVAGAVSLNDVTLDDGSQFLFAGSVGSIVLDGETSLAGNGSTFILDDEDTGLDILGSLTINGIFVGSEDDVDFRASAIGDVTITGALTQDDTLITDLNILAAPNDDDDGSLDLDDADDDLENTAEQVEADGSNLADFSIGDITITTTLSLAYTGTSIFAEGNSFVALGAIGDVNVTGGVKGTQQSALFDSEADMVVFAVGDVDGFDNDTVGLDAINGDANGGILVIEDEDDVDADANDELDDVSSAFADVIEGEVSIGDFMIDARQSTPTDGDNDSGVEFLGGDVATGAQGLYVFSGVNSNNSAGDVLEITDAATTVNVVAISDDLEGSIGDILITSNNAVGFYDDVADVTTIVSEDAGDIYLTGAIAVSGSTGDIQSEDGIDDDDGDDVAGAAVIIGDLDAVDDDTVEGDDPGANGDVAVNQIVVVVV